MQREERTVRMKVIEYLTGGNQIPWSAPFGFLAEKNMTRFKFVYIPFLIARIEQRRKKEFDWTMRRLDLAMGRRFDGKQKGRIREGKNVLSLFLPFSPAHKSLGVCFHPRRSMIFFHAFRQPSFQHKEVGSRGWQTTCCVSRRGPNC